MNNVTVARIYMTFALILLVIGWKICTSTSDFVKQTQLKQAAQIEQLTAAQ